MTAGPVTRKREEPAPAKAAAEPPAKKRRGRPPGLTNRRSGRAQILPTSKTIDGGAKAGEGGGHHPEDESEQSNIHDVPPIKALQMNMVLSDINSRISSSSVRAETNLPSEVPSDVKEDAKSGAKDVEMSKAEVPAIKTEDAKADKDAPNGAITEVLLLNFLKFCK